MRVEPRKLVALAKLTPDPAAFRENPPLSAEVWSMPAPDIASLLTLRDLDRLLRGGAVRADRVEVAHDGQLLPRSEFSRGREPAAPVNTRRIHERVKGGDTVVLNHVHRGWPPLTALCRRLSFETGVRVWANAYLTPANSQGFAHHHDAHSVFIAQTSGSKVWKLYEPAFPAPLDGQSYRTVVAQGDRERLEQQTPALEVTLRAGDVLWVPRGWVHSGRSVDDHSLHVTFGLNPDTPLWLLASALETMTGVEELRRELPWGVVHDPARLADAAASAAKRFAEALAEADWDAFVRDRARAEGRLASDLAGLRLPLYESPPAPNTELLTVRSALQDLALLPDGGVSVRTARQAFTIRGPSGSALFGFLDREEDEPWRLGDLAKETGEQAAVKIVERLADAGVVERWEDHAGR